MNLLALDTSTVACSVALQTGDVVHDRHELRPREHTRLLLPMINDVLAAGGIAVDQLDAVVLGNGPGSFIGLRIAASVAQGLCYGSGAALVPVSSLAAIAVEVFTLNRTDAVLVAQDAHMNEVYLAAFTADSDRLPGDEGTVGLQRAGRVETVPAGAVAAGAGWHRYPDLWDHNRDRLGALLEPRYPRATALLPLGQRALAAGLSVAPALLEPAYIRHNVAAPARHDAERLSSAPS